MKLTIFELIEKISSSRMYQNSQYTGVYRPFFTRSAIIIAIVAFGTRIYVSTDAEYITVGVSSRGEDAGLTLKWEQTNVQGFFRT